MLASFTISLLATSVLLRRDFGQTFPFRTLLSQATVILLPALPLSVLPVVFPIGRLDTLWVLVPTLVLHVLFFFSAYAAILYAFLPKFRATIEELRESLSSAITGGLKGTRSGT